jgi:hypothetical protein
VKYRKLKGYKYQTTENYSKELPWPLNCIWCKGDMLGVWNGYLNINKGYAWDGPSGPTIDTRTFMEASLVHDALYQLMRQGKASRDLRIEADRLLRQMCIEAGMSKARAWYVYRSVRMFGKKATFNGIEKWERIYEV